jgi:hypothetical protein
MHGTPDRGNPDIGNPTPRRYRTGAIVLPAAREMVREVLLLRRGQAEVRAQEQVRAQEEGPLAKLARGQAQEPEQCPREQVQEPAGVQEPEPELARRPWALGEPRPVLPE